MSYPPPQNTKLHERVAVRLCREIVSGRMPAGTPLPAELKLVEENAVSKTVIRETMQLMAAAGLVRIQHGKRTVVQPADEWNILSRLVQEGFRDEGLAGDLVQELYEVRKVFEPQAAAWSAVRASDEEREAIVRIVELMTDSGDIGALRRLLDFDLEFHLAVASATGNRVLRAILRDCHEVLTLNWALTDPGDDGAREIVSQHRRVAEAIARGDADAASQAMREHLDWAAEQDRFAPTAASAR
jgi:GntR family transcriptional repressor for pyruvate dehydrogenase complex